MRTFRYLFVYGSLREGAGHPMGRVLRRHARRIGEARFSGRLFDLGDYPGAVPDPSGAHWVRGELFEMIAAERLLPILDEYEGCGPAEAAPEYRREPCEVTLVEPAPGEAARRMAWVYLYNGPLADRSAIPSGDYLRPEGS